MPFYWKRLLKKKVGANDGDNNTGKIKRSDRPLMKYTVNNGNEYAFSFLNIGATLTSLTMPDKDGNSNNILLSFSEPEHFITDQSYFFGKAIGRVGGRIKDGAFQYNNEHVQLPQNKRNNTLHGGSNGLHSLWWNVSELVLMGV